MIVGGIKTVRKDAKVNERSGIGCCVEAKYFTNLDYFAPV